MKRSDVKRGRSGTTFGGVALARLHAMEGAQPGLVHVDAAAAMTGVSRFGEARAAVRRHGSGGGGDGGGGGGDGGGWRYSKEEGIAPQDMAGRGFDHLLSGESEAPPGFELAEAVEGFTRIALDKSVFPPLRAVTAPQIYIHRRSSGATQ